VSQIPDSIGATTILGMPTPAGSTEYTGQSGQSPLALPVEVTNGINTIGAGIGGIHSLVQQSISSGLDQAQGQITDAHNLVIGSISRGVDQALPPVAKSISRVQKAAKQLVSEAYGYVTPIGVIYPQPDQVQYGLATGDYLGSVGLAYPSNPNPPAGVVAAGVVHGVQPADAMVPFVSQNARDAPGSTIGSGQVNQPVKHNNAANASAGVTTTVSPRSGGVGSTTVPAGGGPGGSGTGICPPGTVSPPGTEGCYTPITVGSSVPIIPTPLPPQPIPVPINPNPPVAPPLPYGPNPWGSGSYSATCPTPVITCPAPPAINVTVSPTPVTVNVTGSGTPSPSPTPTPTPTPTPPLTPEYPEIVCGTGTTLVDGVCEAPEPIACPLPPEPPPVVDSGGYIIAIYQNIWNQITQCPVTAAGTWQLNPVTGTILGFSETPKTSPQWYIDIFGEGWVEDSLIHPLLTGFDRLITWGLANIQQFTGCSGTQAAQSYVIRLLRAMLTRFIGSEMGDLTKSTLYNAQSLCPQEIPSSSEATEAYLGGAISQDLWTCWQRANNKLEVPQTATVFARRTKPDMLQILRLWRWGQIDDATFTAYATQNGIVNNSDLQAIIKANEAIPGPSDLMRFMVRDVGDPNVVADYQLQSEFTDKWTGNIQQWGYAQGLTDDIALAHWEAHWQYPSYTQAAQMMFRLRPDKYPDDADLPTNLRQHVFTSDDFATLLGINDMAPWFRQRMIDISYRVMTRMDARIAFAAGQRNLAAQIGTYQDEGYTEVDATALANADAIKAQHDQAVAIEGGLGERYCKWYVSGLISKAELRAYLGPLIPNGKVLDGKITRCDTQIMVAKRAAIWKCVQAELRGGDITQAQAIQSMAQNGIPIDQATVMVDEFTCSRLPRMKMLSAQQLCQLATIGLIPQASQIQRLQNLGWSLQDATSISNLCYINQANKTAAQVAKNTKAAAAAATKAAKAAAKEEIRQCKLKQAAAKGTAPACADQVDTTQLG
jgi:hypothetical protein